jgi:hypothetical protein
MKTIDLLATAFIVSLFGCNSTTDPSKENTLLLSKKGTDGIVYSLAVPTTQFDLSDTLRGTFQVINESGIERQFNFANIQQLGFQLVDTRGTVALFYPFVVSPATSSLYLQVGEKKEYSIRCIFRDHNGQYIGRGKYQLSAFLLEGNSPHVSLAIGLR